MSKYFVKFVLVALSFIVLSSIFIINVQAEDVLQNACEGRAASSTACRSRQNTNPLFGEDGILTKVIQILVMVVGVAAVIMIMVGGFKYIVSSGDSAQTSSAKNTILFAVIGLVVAVFAQAIVSFILTKL